jgi:hypothetical protein
MDLSISLDDIYEDVGFRSTTPSFKLPINRRRESPHHGQWVMVLLRFPGSYLRLRLATRPAKPTVARPSMAVGSGTLVGLRVSPTLNLVRKMV